MDTDTALLTVIGVATASVLGVTGYAAWAGHRDVKHSVQQEREIGDEIAHGVQRLREYDARISQIARTTVDEGRTARHLGVREEDNPYTDPTLRDLWQSGWERR